MPEDGDCLPKSPADHEPGDEDQGRDHQKEKENGVQNRTHGIGVSLKKCLKCQKQNKGELFNIHPEPKNFPPPQKRKTFTQCD
jgi:hypothetical protein